MVKIARTGISTSNVQTKKILDICWCQNSHLFEGFHPLFHESGVAPLFHPLSASFSQKRHFFGVFQVSVTECLLSVYAPGTPWNVGENKFTRRPILLHGVSNLWSLSFSLFQSFSLRPSENTFISAPQGPGDKATPKRHHPKTFWSSRDSLINHLTPLCACTHTYPCVLGPLHSPLTLEFNFFNWYNHPVS